jgi:hypothetical protein
MSRIWKGVKVWFLYWRFRNITRNRLRLQAWYRKRQPMGGYRPRGISYDTRPRASAAYVYRRSSGRSWALLLGMVVILTLLRYLGNQGELSSTLVYALSTLTVVLALYAALRGT